MFGRGAPRALRHTIPAAAAAKKLRLVGRSRAGMQAILPLLLAAKRCRGVANDEFDGHYRLRVLRLVAIEFAKKSDGGEPANLMKINPDGRQRRSGVMAKVIISNYA